MMGILTGVTALTSSRGPASVGVALTSVVLDQLPAGDLAYLRLVGRLQNADPRARATEEEVARFFAPYEPWAGLAGLHALSAAGDPGALRLAA